MRKLKFNGQHLIKILSDDSIIFLTKYFTEAEQKALLQTISDLVYKKFGMVINVNKSKITSNAYRIEFLG